LPAPLGPVTAKACPGWRSKDRPSNRRRPPLSRARSWTESVTVKREPE
jgi:hypothetical protein